MTETFVLREYRGLPSFVATGPWTDRHSSAYRESKIDSLVLNYALGFHGNNLDFLADIEVARLWVIARTIRDVSGVQSQGGSIRTLSLIVDPRATVDLRPLVGLEALEIGWKQLQQNLATGDQFQWRSLYVERFGDNSLESLSSIGTLQALCMKDRPKLASLEGINHLISLREFGVFGAQRLTDIGALRSMPADSLNRLELESCRGVDSLDSIEGLASLTSLNIGDIGRVESIAPLRGLVELGELNAFESTFVEDGDLSPLLGLVKIRALRMVNRGHYRPSVREVRDTLGLGDARPAFLQRDL